MDNQKTGPAPAPAPRQLSLALDCVKLRGMLGRTTPSRRNYFATAGCNATLADSALVMDHVPSASDWRRAGRCPRTARLDSAAGNDPDRSAKNFEWRCDNGLKRAAHRLLALRSGLGICAYTLREHGTQLRGDFGKLSELGMVG